MRFLTQRNIHALFGLVAVSYVVLAVIGGVKGYSPVPFWDMWDGYLGFFVRASDGDLGAWWAQHNEHRIVLARALFWIDLSIFDGTGWFLIIVNYALVALSFIFLYTCLKESLVEEKDRIACSLIGLLILTLSFSWIQENNLSWGFQSQFIFAQLLPLIAFFLLHKAFVSKIHSNWLFGLACLSGVAALGSMANGILTLPLMTLLAVVIRMGWRRIAILAALAILGTFAYFYNYSAPAGHGSIADALLHHPIRLIQYLLLYIGGPFYYMTGIGSRAMAQSAGVFLIGSSVFFAYNAIRAAGKSSLQLALLTFLLYVGGTALGTGGGRVVFGVDQALASRYMTPALMAWCALLILYAPAMAKRVANNSSHFFLPLLLIPILLLPQQLEALHSRTGELFERYVGALALELGIKDQAQIGFIFPSAEWALSLAKDPVERDLSVFGHASIKDAREVIGEAESTRPSVQCLGSLDEHNVVEGDARYVRIRGWLFQPEQKAVPKAIHIIDTDGKIVGVALAGAPRPDVARAIGRAANQSGFKGYIEKGQVGKSIVLRGVQPDCELRAVARPIPYEVQQVENDASSLKFIGTDAIVHANEWRGADFHKTVLDGFKVVGSFIQSDRDLGAISLKIKRGDAVYYRSGPTGGKQLLVIDSGDKFSQTLPVASEWVILKFTSPDLPESFVLTLTDSGTSWGEWSAIALRSNDE